MLRSLITLSLVLFGCGDQAKPDASPAVSSSGAGSLAESATASTAPPAPIDRSPITTKVDAETKTLHVVAYRGSDDEGAMFFGAQAVRSFRIFPFEKSMVVMQAGQAYELQGGKLTLNSKAVTTEKVPGETPVLGAYEVERLEGSWPDALFATASFHTFLGPRQGSYRTVHYARAAGEWKTRPAPPDSVASWKSGIVLGLAGGKLAVELGPPEGLPAQTPGIDGKCTAGLPLAFGRKVAALSSGEIMVLGTRCDDSRLVVERWSAGGKATVEELPGAPADLSQYGFLDHLRMGSSTSAVVALTRAGKPPYVARFDGNAFRQQEIPDRGDVNDVWVTADGAVWMVLADYKSKPEKSLLVRVLPDGKYSRWQAPRRYRIGTLWASDRETAYVGWSGGDVNRAVLFGTKPDLLGLGAPPEFVRPEVDKSNEPLPSPSAPAGDTPVDGVAAFPKHDDTCKDPFVFLYDVAIQTPPAFPFPLTVKALTAFTKKEGLELVDFKHGGKRRLGVRVPNKDVAAELVKHVKGMMPDDDPELVCFKAPADARKIALPP